VALKLAAAFRRERTVDEYFCDSLEQLLQRKGLGEKGPPPFEDSGHHFGMVRKPGHEQVTGLGMKRGEAVRQSSAVHPRHQNVSEEKVDGTFIATA
jgi:hypothetical protein